MTYSPFPTQELEALALDNDEAAKRLGGASTKFGALYTSRAAMLRNAIACQDALRERCLMAELDRDQARRQLFAFMQAPLLPIEENVA